MFTVYERPSFPGIPRKLKVPVLGSGRVERDGGRKRRNDPGRGREGERVEDREKGKWGYSERKDECSSTIPTPFPPLRDPPYGPPEL